MLPEDDSDGPKCCGVVVHVLNGDYPARAVRRMTKNRLEKLVAKLIHYTEGKSKRDGLKKPKWWPSGLAFNTALNLGVDNDNDRMAILKQLVANCSQFFKTKSKCLQMIDLGENDENHRRIKKRKPDENKDDTTPNKKSFCAFVKIRRLSVEPFATADESPQVPQTYEPPTKNEFMEYFKLDRNGPKGRPPIGQSLTTSYSAKLANCLNIPFSSDVGRMMAARENHHMPESLKLRRLERSEWYTNKHFQKTPPGEYEVQPSSFKEPAHSHRYKTPKRQYYQKRWSLHNVNFMSQFCTPLSVVVERMDLDKINGDKPVAANLVQIEVPSDKDCASDKSKTKFLRTSPRLRRA